MRIAGELHMSLLIAYLACLLIGQSITISIGLMLDRVVTPGISLPISLTYRKTPAPSCSRLPTLPRPRW